MRNLATNESLILDGMFVRQPFDLIADTSLATVGTAWDLTQLDSIETVRSLEVDEKRVEKRTSTRRRFGALGALIGVFLDGAQGDDSVVDGAIGGAIAGYLLSPPPGEARAIVKLHFRDEEMLQLEIDRSELANLEQTAAKVRLQPSRATSPSVVQRALSEAEKAEVLRKRRSQSAGSRFALAGLFLIVSWWFGVLFTVAEASAANDLGRFVTSSAFRYSFVCVGSLIGLALLLDGIRTRRSMALDFYRRPDEPDTVTS